LKYEWTTLDFRGIYKTLNLERLDVVHAGANTYPLAEGIRAVAFRRLFEDLEPLSG
jgi:hypothetical protein